MRALTQTFTFSCFIISIRISIRAFLLLPLIAVLAASMPAVECWTGEQLDEIRSIQGHVVAKDGLFSVTTSHYVVRSEIDARFTAELARYLELFDDQATSLLMLPAVAAPGMAVVTVFASQTDYQKSLGKATRSRGQFDWLYPDETSPARYTIRTYAANLRERDFRNFFRPIINHETTHYLLQLRAGRRHIPNLVHEGIATYVQAWDFFKPTSWNLANHCCEFAPNLRHAVDAQEVPSMSWLSQVSTWDVDDFGPQTNTRYACAESFIAYLLGDDSRKSFFKRLVTAATGGESLRGLFANGAGSVIEEDWRRCLFLSSEHRG
ncbi:MAG: hypothetical protein H0W83_05290 [Planctomycetes bacterium]|nr:hypothetical protein [Planctomycetota bacterium]